MLMAQPITARRGKLALALALVGLWLALSPQLAHAAQPPTITVSSPAQGASYPLDSNVEVEFSCADPGGPGIAPSGGCVGTSASGSHVVLVKPGKHQFTVTALSADGLKVSKRVSYSVYRKLPAGKAACKGRTTKKIHELVVHNGAVCDLAAGSVVSVLRVEPGGSLVGEGVSIGNLLTNDPAGLRLVGARTNIVENNLQVVGLSGTGGGAANEICNTRVNENLLISRSAAQAGPLVVGGAGTQCPKDFVGLNMNVSANADNVQILNDKLTDSLLLSRNTASVEAGEDVIGHDLGVTADTGASTARADQIGHNLTVEHNSGPVSLLLDTIGKDLKVNTNLGGAQLEQDLIAGTAECSEDTPAPAGAGNTVTGTNKGCPL